jgi:ferredoxin
MTTQFKVCNCNRTMPLDAQARENLGAALGLDKIEVATQLCRRDIGPYLEAIQGNDEVVIACTQEQALFQELAEQKQAHVPIRFVNIRETAGWSKQAKQSVPKMAALLAAAALPDPEPVPTVEYQSAGQLLIIGSGKQVLPWAEHLGKQLNVSILLTDTQGGKGLSRRTFPTYSGSSVKVEGWLGAFKVSWQQSNPIDLETCTRCNACIQACPEGAIDFNYQIDLDKCRSHRDCVSVCGPIGAIDFQRLSMDREAEFDLIFDLSEQAVIDWHQPPQGYFAAGTDQVKQAQMALTLTDMVGTFAKPKFFTYKEKLCAHGRNQKTGCTSCIDVCSAKAISSQGDRIKVNPNLCVGCGTCTTVCPSGALGYAYPRAADLGITFKTLLRTYFKAGGKQPALLLHSQNKGTSLIEEAGRLALTNAAMAGLPARVIPVALHHTASVGLELWMSAIAYGASNIAILTTDEEAPDYIAALQHQISIAQSILAGLGYTGIHLHLLQCESPQQLDAALSAVQPAAVPSTHATFNLMGEKRTSFDLALDHLLKHAPAVTEEIALPAGSLFGTVTVNKDACTLCMSCVGACPESALMDNPSSPQLRFVEKNCVQCGLCEKTCPENAIALTSRLLLTEAVKQPAILNEAQPYHCIKCSKPFGTLQMIEGMLAKLSLHSAFSGNLDRLKMCSDCRVVDMMENKNEVSILDIGRPR